MRQEEGGGFEGGAEADRRHEGGEEERRRVLLGGRLQVVEMCVGSARVLLWHLCDLVVVGDVLVEKVAAGVVGLWGGDELSERDRELFWREGETASWTLFGALVLALFPLPVLSAIHRFGERDLYPRPVHLGTVQGLNCFQTGRVRLQVHECEVLHLLDPLHLSELREDVLQFLHTRV